MSRDWWDDAFIMDIPIEIPLSQRLGKAEIMDLPEPARTDEGVENPRMSVRKISDPRYASHLGIRYDIEIDDRTVDSPPGKNQRKGENMSATGEAFKVRMVILDSDHLPRMDNGDHRYSDDVVEEFKKALEKFVTEWVTTGPGKDYVRSYSDSYDPMKDPEISVMNVPWNG